jgi:PEP-CTERM motif
MCFGAGATFANNIHVVFDPIPAQQGDFNLIQQEGTSYQVNWVPCSTPGVPDFPGDDLTGEAACLLFSNVTGGNIDSLNISFTVTAALATDTLSCDSNGQPFLTANNCGAVPSPLMVGEVVDVTFLSGSPVPNEFNFFLAEDGVPLSALPSLNVTAPEPASLMLLASGMGLLGLCVAFAKR